MAFVKYLEHQFQQRSIDMYINPAREILADYAEREFTLTLRQLYYQFVARNLLPNNALSYANLGDMMKHGRNAGLIDWDWIEDRSRTFNRPPTWSSPKDMLQAAADSYREDLWASQPRCIWVYVEKDALSNVFRAVCAEYRLPFYAHRGYDSTSNSREAGVRLAEETEPLILCFTDHDPAGLDMRRDLTKRLELYAEEPVEVRVLGLTRDQVNQYNPPPNFAKETDKHYRQYVAAHGPHCWELDALSPEVLDQLVRDVAPCPGPGAT